MKPEVHAVRVNVKSLAAEARIIRQEIRKARTTEAKNMLAVHKNIRVKPEARLAQLALAFFKEMPYKKVEQEAKNIPAVKEVLNKLKRFSCAVEEKAVKDWLSCT